MKPLTIIFWKTNAYAKSYDSETNLRLFLIQDKELRKRYRGIQNDISSSIRKEFDNKLVYNKRYLKTKTRSYSDEATDFNDKRLSKA